MDLDSIFKQVGGIRPVVGDRFIPLTLDEVVRFEDEHGIQLPPLYKKFLTVYGASGFVEWLDYRPRNGFPPEYTLSDVGHLSLLYGSEDSEHEGYGLVTRVLFYATRIPRELIPIGDNGGGNQICLGIQGEYYGKVYIWDSEHEPPSEEEYLEDYDEPRPPDAPYWNVHLIANSFEDFLQTLEISRRV